MLSNRMGRRLVAAGVSAGVLAAGAGFVNAQRGGGPPQTQQSQAVPVPDGSCAW